MLIMALLSYCQQQKRAMLAGAAFICMHRPLKAHVLYYSRAHAGDAVLMLGQ